MVPPPWLSVSLNPSTTLPGKQWKFSRFPPVQPAKLLFSSSSLRLVKPLFIQHPLQLTLSCCNNPGNRGAMMRACDALLCAGLLLLVATRASCYHLFYQQFEDLRSAL